MNKKILKIIMFVFIFIGAIFFGGNNITEARTDYYIGYDPDVGCDAYLDVDSIQREGYSNGGRIAWADVYWVSGDCWPSMGVRYEPSTGTYYYSSGRGGFNKVTSGFDYKFCVICDRLAYGK